MQLMKSFNLLLSNECYSSCAGILRMQVDNVLRFHGVLLAKDPHEVANSVLNGIAIRKINDDSGKKMADARLVELMKPQIPWVGEVYDYACNYIHLSDQHVYQFANRSEVGSDGLKDISIGDGDEHMSAEQKAHLEKAFSLITGGVLELVRQWTATRHQYGTDEELASRFGKAF